MGVEGLASGVKCCAMCSTPSGNLAVGPRVLIPGARPSCILLGSRAQWAMPSHAVRAELWTHFFLKVGRTERDMTRAPAGGMNASGTLNNRWYLHAGSHSRSSPVLFAALPLHS